jgi:hypothetical protein
MRRERLIVRKTEIPPVLLKKKINRVISIENKLDWEKLKIKKPEVTAEESKKIIYDLKDIPDRKGVLITKAEEKFIIEEDFIDAYSLAVELSALYRLPLMVLYEKIKSTYPNEEIPESHALEIKKYLEENLKGYEIKEEEIEVALALIKPMNFNKEESDGKTIYTTEIIYHKDKEDLLLRYEPFKEQNKAWYQLELGFHYDPYNFDSHPEKDFFINLLNMLNENPADVEDIYFTGAINDPNKTDFVFEYKGKDDGWHNYSPDFLIKKKNGKMLIIEIKAEPYRDLSKEKAMKEIEELNPEKLKYEILITDKDEIGFDNLQKLKKRFMNIEHNNEDKRSRYSNFRSIKDLTFRLNDYSLLIGPNNSGKTNIIDALRIFYEKEKFDSEDIPKFETDDQESWIEIDFQLTNEEFLNLKDDYKRDSNSLKVRKYLRSSDRSKVKSNQNNIYGYEKVFFLIPFLWSQEYFRIKTRMYR